ncbi:MAG: potassium transporter Kup [Gammaproteobacteria bacterium]
MANGTDLHQTRAALTLAALGIVFGDIGTSPLYAVRETFNPDHGIPLENENILGGISSIFWAVMLVVTLKYVMLIMRADNKGEGGIMAMLALAISSYKGSPFWSNTILLAGLTGTALFYGDAILTPAISVVSAVEGLAVGTTAFQHYVLPISVGVLIALFLFQQTGTASIGALFGPITLLWFLALAAGGIYGIIKYPAVLTALNPQYALLFITQHGFASFVVLGAILLAFTGAEALYADMGHVGRDPIRLAWLGLVFPALTLNYMGQGALLMSDRAALSNPFYLLFPAWALYPMVVLATTATVIASQATISGAYSLTRQAIQLGFLPRMNIIQTSAREFGQIYVPLINWALLVAVLAAVLGFGSSSNLASAYGVAVTGTMVIDTFLTFFVIRYHWNFGLLICLLITGSVMLIDVPFFASSLLKLADGGWFPIVVGITLLTIMITWWRGRQMLFAKLLSSAVPLDQFLAYLTREPITRVAGTAVFLTATPEAVPHAMLHNLNHNKVLHERVVILNVEVRNIPWVPFDERVAAVESLGENLWRIRLCFGFKNRLDVTQALTELCKDHGLQFNIMDTSFFLSRETIIPIPTKISGMAFWRERLFATMSKNAGSVVEYFNIPSNRVIELGTQIEI